MGVGVEVSMDESSPSESGSSGITNLALLLLLLLTPVSESSESLLGAEETGLPRFLLLIAPFLCETGALDNFFSGVAKSLLTGLQTLPDLEIVFMMSG